MDSSRNPSYVFRTEEVDAIVDRILKGVHVDPVDAWQTGLNDSNTVYGYVVSRWGRSTRGGTSRRIDNLTRKIYKTKASLDHKQHPATVWRVSLYNHGVLCFLSGCDMQAAREMAWSLYSWLLPDKIKQSGDPRNLDVAAVGMGGQMEVIRRMSSLISTMEDNVRSHEDEARSRIKRAREMRTRVEVIKLNLLNNLSMLQNSIKPAQGEQDDKTAD